MGRKANNEHTKAPGPDGTTVKLLKVTTEAMPDCVTKLMKELQKIENEMGKI